MNTWGGTGRFGWGPERVWGVPGHLGWGERVWRGLRGSWGEVQENLRWVWEGA